MFTHKVRLTWASGYQERSRHRGLPSSCGTCAHKQAKAEIARREKKEDEPIRLTTYGTKATVLGTLAILAAFFSISALWVSFFS